MIPSPPLDPTELDAALRDVLSASTDLPIRVRHVGALVIVGASVAALRPLSPSLLDAWARAHLARQEMAAWKGMPIRKRSLEWLAGRVAIKWAVVARARRHDATVLEPRGVRVRTLASGSRKGRPYVTYPCHVSMSHSADAAVAVAAPGFVGVDVERVRRLSEDLQRFAFTTRETGEMRSDSDATVLRWACKESLLKACGTGMRAPMRDIEVDGPMKDGRFTWRVLGSGPLLMPIRSRPCARGYAGIFGQYAAAVVWGEKGSPWATT